ncbi:MAG: ABC transporter permease [Actinomycetota bacterium]|nr:ABC transporter permease [Actinomycetota bacterium]
MNTAAPTFPPISTRPGVGFAWAARDTLAMVWRNLTVIRRVPQLLVFAIVQPLIFVFMFRYVFGGAIPSGASGLPYVDYLMPGIFVQTVTFGAINTAVGLAEDKNNGLLERLKSLPMSRSAVLGGRVLADSTRNVLVVVLMVLVGFLVGFHTHTSVLKVIAGIGLMVLFGFAVCWIFAVIGLSVANGEAAQAAAFPLIAPLTFASNAFVPTATMPGWLQWWAERQPLSVTVGGVRALMLGNQSMDYVWGSIAWSLGITVVLAPLAVRRFRNS